MRREIVQQNSFAKKSYNEISAFKRKRTLDPQIIIVQDQQKDLAAASTKLQTLTSSPPAVSTAVKKGFWQMNKTKVDQIQDTTKRQQIKLQPAHTASVTTLLNPAPSGRILNSQIAKQTDSEIKSLIQKEVNIVSPIASHKKLEQLDQTISKRGQTSPLTPNSNRKTIFHLTTSSFYNQVAAHLPTIEIQDSDHQMKNLCDFTCSVQKLLEPQKVNILSNSQISEHESYMTPAKSPQLALQPPITTATQLSNTQNSTTLKQQYQRKDICVTVGKKSVYQRYKPNSRPLFVQYLQSQEDQNFFQDQKSRHETYLDYITASIKLGSQQNNNPRENFYSIAVSSASKTCNRNTILTPQNNQQVFEKENLSQTLELHKVKVLSITQPSRIELQTTEANQILRNEESILPQVRLDTAAQFSPQNHISTRSRFSFLFENQTPHQVTKRQITEVNKKDFLNQKKRGVSSFFQTQHLPPQSTLLNLETSHSKFKTSTQFPDVLKNQLDQKISQSPIKVQLDKNQHTMKNLLPIVSINTEIYNKTIQLSNELQTNETTSTREKQQNFKFNQATHSKVYDAAEQHLMQEMDRVADYYVEDCVL